MKQHNFKSSGQGLAQMRSRSCGAFKSRRTDKKQIRRQGKKICRMAEN